MANPQPTPFVQFSKELFDALLFSGMPATHKELVLAVIRRTYGEHGQKSASISQSLLQRMTGRSRNGVRRSLDELIEQGVIVQVSPPSFAKPAVLGLNKDYEKWGKWSVDRATVVAQGQELDQDHESVGGQGHSDGGGQGHHGVPGQGHSDGPIEYIDTKDMETSRAARAGQSGKKSTQGKMDGFDAFWKLYPKKQDRGHAKKAWAQALKKADAATIIEGLEQLLPGMVKKEAQYVPLGATWLNGERWTDEPDRKPGDKPPPDLNARRQRVANARAELAAGGDPDVARARVNDESEWLEAVGS